MRKPIPVVLTSIIILWLLPTAARTQETYIYKLNKELWSIFSGELDGEEIVMSLFPDTSDGVRGDYFDKESETKIPLSGNIQGDSIFLKGYDDVTTVLFKGKLIDKDGNYYQGIFRILPDGKEVFFKLMHTGGTGGTFEHRYTDLYGTTEEVEQFVKSMKQAVLTKNTEWLSTHIDYPINVAVGPNKIVKITSSKEFVDNAHRIFSASFREFIRSYRTKGLWHNHYGVSFGRGEIFIQNKKGSTPENYGYAIKEIYGYSFDYPTPD